MTIVYAVICRARDAAVLVEVATEALDGSNAPQVTIGGTSASTKKVKVSKACFR